MNTIYIPGYSDICASDIPAFNTGEYFIYIPGYSDICASDIPAFNTGKYYI